ncbi:DUF7619 domain-containing protein [Flavobacterium terrisoli]|uniref:DUF7619 domain-containing protein n=1 Tax=Flavobacterium terrisoli TaxID=3242195 RepID=UPI002542DD46|nr:T9SS type A sorting domain-containing protein [Flavobacterium buctense]
MKKLYTLLALALTVFTSNAQIVNIPDANFKAKLLLASPSNSIARNLSGNNFKIDANSDGEIQESEALQVKYLNVSGYSGMSNSLKMSNLIGIEYFTNLWDLKCNYHLLTSLNVGNITSLRYLECSFNQIGTLNTSLLTNLIRLDCSYNQIGILDASNLNNLTFLDCSSNNISILNTAALSALRTLHCGGNNLSSLIVTNSPLLSSLRCSDNSLTSLNITNLTDLTLIDCQGNNLTSLTLSNLPNLEALNFEYNDITSINLPPLNNLQTLNCSSNLLTSLDLSGLSSLYILSYGNPGLTNVIGLNSLVTLFDLSISYSTQTTLDISNLVNLTGLDLYNFHLQSLDLSNFPNLSSLFLYQGNYLNYLNMKNGGNFNYVTINQCNTLDYVCANEVDVLETINTLTSYSNYPNVQVNSYCSFNPGGDYNTVSGVVHYDSNFNGCAVTDPTFNGVRIGIDDGANAGATFTANSGSYFFFVQEPNITLSPSFENPTYFNVSPSSVTLNFPTNNNTTQTQDFCMERNGIHNDLEITLIPTSPARPGFDATYSIHYRNKGTDIQSGSVTLSFDDTKIDLVSANPTASSAATNSLTWNFSNLQPFESRLIRLTFNINSPTETPAVNNGDILSYTAVVNGAVDETPSDNTSTLNQIVFNSFDPNDKTCIEGTSIVPSMVGQYVHYVIRFENTGSANAQNIVVRDMIDTTKFDITSLVPQTGSHPFVTRISSNNRVEFIFENINLPFDNANNDGYVAFKIKTKPTLVVGNTFSNSASIYFDYNFPIVTDTFTTTVQALGNQDFEFSSMFTLSPVPTKNILKIATKETVVMSSVSIYNTLGQLVQVNTNPGETIDVSALQSGSYFIKIISDKGSVTGKFIKE